MQDILYGDGIHDDYPAIQEMLDSGMTCVYLPDPEKHYLISSSLRIHSNQELKLNRYTRVRLTEQANCAMVTNAEPKAVNENIMVTGGIWDMNHNNQKPNPGHFPDPDTGLTLSQWNEKNGFDPNGTYMQPIYTGICFIFNHVKGLHIRDLTIENPVLYGMDISYTEDFTVENIQFEYNEGSPKLWNLDGVHIEGGCRNGLIRNLHGACHDNMVALTSDDWIFGPIENITIDGLYAYHSHSAVRLLSVQNPVKNVNISNIYGTYYRYCVVIDKYRKVEERAAFENINISNIYASLCPGTEDVTKKPRPLIVVGPNLDMTMLNLSNLYRNETYYPAPTIGVLEDTHIRKVSVFGAAQTNATGEPMPFMKNDGTIDTLYLVNIDTDGDELLNGNGTVNCLVKN